MELLALSRTGLVGKAIQAALPDTSGISRTRVYANKGSASRFDVLIHLS